jgi:hypothetical protein
MGDRRSACLLAAAAAVAVVLFQAASAAVLGGGGPLLDPRRLEKFVDELPDMPRLRGYGVMEGGRLVAGNLTIGMYDTTWVSAHTRKSIDVLSSIKLLVDLYMHINYNCSIRSVASLKPYRPTY